MKKLNLILILGMLFVGLFIACQKTDLLPTEEALPQVEQKLTAENQIVVGHIKDGETKLVQDLSAVQALFKKNLSAIHKFNDIYIGVEDDQYFIYAEGETAQNESLMTRQSLTIGAEGELLAYALGRTANYCTGHNCSYCRFVNNYGCYCRRPGAGSDPAQCDHSTGPGVSNSIGLLDRGLISATIDDGTYNADLVLNVPAEEVEQAYLDELTGTGQFVVDGPYTISQEAMQAIYADGGSSWPGGDVGISPGLSDVNVEAQAIIIIIITDSGDVIVIIIA